MSEIKGQYGRVKGAEWFGSLYKKDILVLGAGGIGSWLSLLLSRLGCNLYIYDMDIYEEHNMSGQAVVKDAIGKFKTEATRDLIAQFSPDCEVSIEGEYTEESMSNNIVLCGFDNMTARKIAFQNWKEGMLSKEDLPEKKKLRKNYFFIDGRLNAEHMQVFCIKGDDEEVIKRYEEEYLFDDTEVEEQDCTFKQTSHCAAMIGAKMVSFLVNWAYNKDVAPVRAVPFFYEYLPPLNYTS